MEALKALRAETSEGEVRPWTRWIWVLKKNLRRRRRRRERKHDIFLFFLGFCANVVGIQQWRIERGSG